MLCNLSSVEERPIVLLLHACRRLLGPTQLDDQVPDTQLWLCFWHKNMRHCSHGLNPAGNFRDNHTECYKDMLLLLNIRLANKSLFLGPSSSKIPATKLWRCSPFNHWAMLVRLLNYFYLQHNIHAPKSLNFFALFSQVIDIHKKCIEYYDSPSTSIP